MSGEEKTVWFRLMLSKPVKHGDEEITELSLREPITKDIRVCGYPLILGEGSATPHPDVIAKFVARLAAVPPSVVDQLSPADFTELMGAIIPFVSGSGPA